MSKEDVMNYVLKTPQNTNPVILSQLLDGVKSSDKNAYNYIKQIADYLFEVQYSTANVDYDYANDYFKALPEEDVIEGAGCSGVYKDGKVLRQLDWFYNPNPDFIVRRPADPEAGIYASIGIASSIKDLSKETVESGEYNKKFQMVPFIMTDGINEKGLYVQSNVVPKMEGKFNIEPDNYTDECCLVMAVRYILDHCATLEDVHKFFNINNAGHVHIFGSKAVAYGYHFLIAQGTTWEVIEFSNVDGKTVATIVTEGTGENQMPHGIMTNFHTDGLNFTDDDIDWESVEEYGLGVERYEIATKAFTEGVTLEQLREDLKFTNLYTNTQANTRWNTDLAGEEYEGHKLTVLDARDNPQYYDDVFTQEAQDYSNRSRYEADPKTWQTTHSAIYDLSNKTINVCIQERFDEEFNFSLNPIAANVPQTTQTDYPTAAEFNALLTALKDAGLMVKD